MFFVCKKVNDKYGIIDTDDGVIEYYTPEQVCALAKKLKIHGVEPKTTGIEINIVTPEVFKVITKDFYPFSLYDAKQAQVKASKFSFTGNKYFYNMFDDILPGKSYSYKTCLEVEYWRRDEIAFRLRNYTEDDDRPFFRQQQSFDVVASKIQEIFNNSPYRNYARLANTQDIINAIKDSYYSKPFIFLKVPRVYKDFIRNQVTDFYHDKNVLERLSHAWDFESFDFENLKCTCYKDGYDRVFNLFFNYEGLIICLIYHARRQYISDSACFDSLESFLNKRLKED